MTDLSENTVEPSTNPITNIIPSSVELKNMWTTFMTDVYSLKNTISVPAITSDGEPLDRKTTLKTYMYPYLYPDVSGSTTEETTQPYGFKTHDLTISGDNLLLSDLLGVEMLFQFLLNKKDKTIEPKYEEEYNVVEKVDTSWLKRSA